MPDFVINIKRLSPRESFCKIRPHYRRFVLSRQDVPIISEDVKNQAILTVLLQFQAVYLSTVLWLRLSWLLIITSLFFAIIKINMASQSKLSFDYQGDKPSKLELRIPGGKVIIGPDVVPTSKASVPKTRIQELIKAMREASKLGLFEPQVINDR